MATTVGRSNSGLRYLIQVLRDGPWVISKAVFYGIDHNSPQDDVRLKIGRYWKSRKLPLQPETLKPRSELTLGQEEFDALIEFLRCNYEPFRSGATEYISLDGTVDARTLDALKRLFRDQHRQGLLALLADPNILPEDLFIGLQHSKRVRAVQVFEQMLQENLLEDRWQAWFKANPWVLGTEFVRVLEERDLDLEATADFLTQAYDGFLDIIEIKRPGGGLSFWTEKPDHGNYYPSASLTKAVIQSIQYIRRVEMKANDMDFSERMGRLKVVKPRCVLLFGRSNDWNEAQREAYRVLNSSFHNLTILTYDHVLDRAKRMLSIDGNEKQMVIPQMGVQMSPQEVDELTCAY